MNRPSDFIQGTAIGAFLVLVFLNFTAFIVFCRIRKLPKWKFMALADLCYQWLQNPSEDYSNKIDEILQADTKPQDTQ